MHGLRYALVGTLALVNTLDAHAKCAMVAFVAKPLTAANSAVGPTGGVVVGLTYDDRQGGTAQVEQKGWRFEQGGKLVVPTIKLLAPSLAVYEFAGANATLVDDKKKALVSVRRGNQPAELATPRLRTATSDAGDDSVTRWRQSISLTLELAAPAPRGAVGLILYVAKTPVNWMVLDRTAAIRFHGGGHCANELPGTAVPITGDITVAYFDGTGRVSALSAPITIKQPAKP